MHKMYHGAAFRKLATEGNEAEEKMSDMMKQFNDSMKNDVMRVSSDSTLPTDVKMGWIPTEDIERILQLVLNANGSHDAKKALEVLSALIARVQELENKSKIDMEQCDIMTDKAAVYATRIADLENHMQHSERWAKRWKELCKRHDAWHDEYFPPEEFHNLRRQVKDLVRENAELKNLHAKQLFRGSNE